MSIRTYLRRSSGKVESAAVSFDGHSSTHMNGKHGPWRARHSHYEAIRALSS